MWAHPTSHDIGVQGLSNLQAPDLRHVSESVALATLPEGGLWGRPVSAEELNSHPLSGEALAPWSVDQLGRSQGLQSSPQTGAMDPWAAYKVSTDLQDAHAQEQMLPASLRGVFQNSSAHNFGVSQDVAELQDVSGLRGWYATPMTSAQSDPLGEARNTMLFVDSPEAVSKQPNPQHHLHMHQLQLQQEEQQRRQQHQQHIEQLQAQLEQIQLHVLAQQLQQQHQLQVQQQQQHVQQHVVQQQQAQHHHLDISRAFGTQAQRPAIATHHNKLAVHLTSQHSRSSNVAYQQTAPAPDMRRAFLNAGAPAPAGTTWQQTAPAPVQVAPSPSAGPMPALPSLSIIGLAGGASSAQAAWERHQQQQHQQRPTAGAPETLKHLHSLLFPDQAPLDLQRQPKHALQQATLHSLIPVITTTQAPAGIISNANVDAAAATMATAMDAAAAAVAPTRHVGKAGSSSAGWGSPAALASSSLTGIAGNSAGGSGGATPDGAGAPPLPQSAYLLRQLQTLRCSNPGANVNAYQTSGPSSAEKQGGVAFARAFDGPTSGSVQSNRPSWAGNDWDPRSAAQAVPVSGTGVFLPTLALTDASDCSSPLSSIEASQATPADSPLTEALSRAQVQQAGSLPMVQDALGLAYGPPSEPKQGIAADVDNTFPTSFMSSR